MAEFKVNKHCMCIESITIVGSNMKSYSYHKNNIYLVKDINICQCGKIHLWLGEMAGELSTMICMCDRGFDTYRAYIGSIYFIPLDDFKEVTFREIKEGIPICAQ